MFIVPLILAALACLMSLIGIAAAARLAAAPDANEDAVRGAVAGAATCAFLAAIVVVSLLILTAIGS